MAQMDRLKGALQLLRQERKQTQQQLANALCVSPSLVGAWERGRRVPSVPRLGDLADVLDLDLGDLDDAIAIAQSRPPRFCRAGLLRQDADPPRLVQLLIGSPSLLAITPAEQALSALLANLRALIQHLRMDRLLTQPKPKIRIAKHRQRGPKPRQSPNKPTRAKQGP